MRDCEWYNRFDMLTAEPAPITPPALWFREFVKFGMVGVAGAIVDLGLLNLLHLRAGLNIYAATAVAFVAAVLVVYTLNNFWTYRRLGLKFTASNLLKYAAISTVGLGITELIIELLSVRNDLNFNFAKIIAIGIVFFWNFFANRAWTFRPKD